MLCWISRFCKSKSHLRLADKTWLKVLFANLLCDKNTTEWLADSVDKLKQIG